VFFDELGEVVEAGGDGEGEEEEAEEEAGVALGRVLLVVCLRERVHGCCLTSSGSTHMLVVVIGTSIGASSSCCYMFDMFHSAQLTLPQIRVVTSSRIYRTAAARRLSYREVKPKSLEAEFMNLRQKSSRR
jgi:hypothetical protein